MKLAWKELQIYTLVYYICWHIMILTMWNIVSKNVTVVDEKYVGPLTELAQSKLWQPLPMIRADNDSDCFIYTYLAEEIRIHSVISFRLLLLNFHDKLLTRKPFEWHYVQYASSDMKQSENINKRLTAMWAGSIRDGQ